MSALLSATWFEVEIKIIRVFRRLVYVRLFASPLVRNYYEYNTPGWSRLTRPLRIVEEHFISATTTRTRRGDIRGPQTAHTKLRSHRIQEHRIIGYSVGKDDLGHFDGSAELVSRPGNNNLHIVVAVGIVCSRFVFLLIVFIRNCWILIGLFPSLPK